MDNEDFQKIREEAKKSISTAADCDKVNFIKKGFLESDSKVINGILIADEFLVMVKEGIHFVILDGIISCSKNTVGIQGVCIECEHYDNCIFILE